MKDFRSGGLNQMRWSEYLEFIRRAGLRVEFLAVNPQLRRLPPLYALSGVLRRIPGIRDYIVSSVYTILR